MALFVIGISSPQLIMISGSANIGPFQATAELIRAAKIKRGDTVLDIGCGTGAALKAASQSIDHSGVFVGADISYTALSIARSYLPEAQLAQMDAENMGINVHFDEVLYQYALMFFPNPGRVLRGVRTIMKDIGVLAVLVHGNPEGVPYFSTIMEPVLRHIRTSDPKVHEPFIALAAPPRYTKKSLTQSSCQFR